jgi:hypothetical protein
MKFKHASIVPLCIGILFLSSCSSNQAIADLQVAVDLADIAFQAVAASASIPPDVQTLVVNYLQATDTALSQASAILAGPGTSAEKAAQVTAAFAAAVKPLLPAGTSQVVASAVNAVAAAIAKFLEHFAWTVPIPKAKPDQVKALNATQRKAQANLQRMKMWRQ